MFIIRKFFLVIVLLVCLFGCKDKKQHHDKKILSIGNLGEVNNIDPQVVSNGNDIKFLSAIFEGLVVPEPDTYQPLPGVAERWNISEDGKVYEFYLRKNARWSNGDFVTADDFVFSIKRALSSRLGCSFVEMFFPIKNAKKFYKREIRDFSKVGVTAIDKHTLRIELEHPCSSFIYLVMQPCWYPLNKMVCESFKSFGELNINCGDLCFSNGPFIITECEPYKGIILEKNPYYWNYDEIKLDGVQWIFVYNETEILKMFQDGVIDVVPYNIIDAVVHDNLAEDITNLVDANEIKSAICLGCCYFAFNTSNIPLNDRNIRVALATAVDREKLLALLPKDAACVAYGLIPLLSPEFDAKPLFQEDVEHAKTLLKQAGCADSCPKLKMICNDRYKCHIIAEFLKDEWKRNLNIDVEVKYYHWDKFLSYRKQGKFDLAFSEWFGDYPDPMTFLSLFSNMSQQNYCHWNNSEYNRLLELASSSYNLHIRSQILKRAEKCLMNNMPIMPLYFEYNTYLIKERVSGWNVNLMNVYPWKFIDLKIK